MTQTPSDTYHLQHSQIEPNRTEHLAVCPLLDKLNELGAAMSLLCFTETLNLSMVSFKVIGQMQKLVDERLGTLRLL